MGLKAEDSADDWWLFQQLAGGNRQERVELERHESPRARAAWAARERVEGVMAEGGGPAIELVLALLATAPDAEGIGAVGVGPLEDLINDHGDALVDLVERTARQHPQFAASLRSINVEDGALEPKTAARLGPWLPTP